jgi:3'-5' exoribonuclease
MTQSGDPVVAPPGSAVNACMLVHQVERRAYGEGRAGVVLTLGTSGGRIASAPLWGERQEWAVGLNRGTIVRIAGRIGEYRGARQLELSALSVVPAGSISLRTVVPATTTTAADWTALDRARCSLRAARLRRVLSLLYDDPGFRSAYQDCPASTVGHHAQLGGLLRHTVEVASIGRAAALACGADPELVFTGALLHDIGKVEAYQWHTGVFELTDPGALLGHVTLGMLMLDRRLRAQATPPCSHRESLILHHLIASHHGALEFGAPVRPMTLEAEVLHHADHASARATSMADALAASEHFAPGERVSSRSLWQVDHRRIYRGGSDWGRDGEALAEA